MRVLLFLGLAFEALANRLQRGLVLGVKRILQWPPGRTIALAHHLQHLDGRNQRRDGQVLERPILGDAHRSRSAPPGERGTGRIIFLILGRRQALFLKI